MPRATQVDDAATSATNSGGLNALDDLFGILDSSDNKETQGDFSYPTFQNTRAVWADLCERLGVDPGVLSGGLGDDDVGSDHPETDAVFCRTCPHMLPELQHPETTWRAYGGPSLCHIQTSTMSPALKNCFCNHHCSVCPPPSEVTAALTAAMSKSKKGSSNNNTVISEPAASATSGQSAEQSPFHGHCLGCLGEFLVNKQYALDGQSSSKRGGGGNVAAEFYPCLCLSSTPSSSSNGEGSHLLQHFEYHNEQAGLALDELDALDDEDDEAESSGDKNVETEAEDGDLVCITNNPQTTSRSDLEQLATYHRQHCLYTFAIGLANEPIHVLFCASCNMFAPLCGFTRKKTTFTSTNMNPAAESEPTPTDNKSSPSSPAGASPPASVWLASDTASTLLYKMLLVAHVSLTITASNLERDRRNDDVETGSVESSVQQIKVALQGLNELTLKERQERFTSVATPLECSEAAKKRLFMCKPCVATPVQFDNIDGSEDIRAILQMCEMLDQEKCDAINDAFFEEGAEETIYESLGPSLLPHRYLQDGNNDNDDDVGSEKSNITPLQENMTIHKMMSSAEGGNIELANMGVSYALGMKTENSSSDSSAFGVSEAAVGFVVDFTSPDAVQAAISKMNVLLLNRGLEIWGYQQVRGDVTSSSSAPQETIMEGASTPSIGRYFQSLLQTNGQHNEALQLAAKVRQSTRNNNKPVTSTLSGLDMFTIPVLQISCCEHNNTVVPTVYVPATEASNHPDINFIDITTSTTTLKLVPTQFLALTMVPITIRVTGAENTTGLTTVVVQNNDAHGASSSVSDDFITQKQYEVSALLSSCGGDAIGGDSGLLSYVQNIEGMRFSTAPSSGDTSGTGTTSQAGIPVVVAPKQTLNSQNLLDNTEPNSVAARALGQLAIAGGCPLSQPAANLQLMNTVATIARVISAIWEKFGGSI